MSTKAEMIQAREEYITLVKQELLGPGSEISIPDSAHELISEYPSTRYSVGILYTKENKINADNSETMRITSENESSDEEVEILEKESEVPIPQSVEVEAINDPDEDNLDEEIGLATQNMPSSMGFTFFAKGNADKVNCKMRFGTYRVALASDCKIPFSEEGFDSYDLPSDFTSYIYYDRSEKCLKISTQNLKRRDVRDLETRDLLFGGDAYGLFDSMYKLADQANKGFVRVPHEVSVILSFDGADYIDKNKDIDGTKLKITALRRRIDDDLYSITVMVVNDDDRKNKAEYCIYQPELSVNTKENDFLLVEAFEAIDMNSLDDEEQSLILQYRNKKSYGSGLGTSVAWDINELGEGEIRNDFFPETEVSPMDFRISPEFGVSDKAFSMKFLSDLDKTPIDEKYVALQTIIDAYKLWINKLTGIELEEKYKYIAEKNIKGCIDAAERMQNGLNIIKTDDNARIAFLLANRAMFMQRAHLKIQSKTANIARYPDDEELSSILEDIDYNDIEKTFKDLYSWRPFQIAFLLMSVESITNDTSIDRDIVDLIWFPTGGGKTEAYLGLTAFTIFYRRLAHLDESSGTTVIMRYTLRLLAAQQFTRASTLICACEFIRVDATSKKSKYGKYPLGKERITIGLWIGGEHTPNKNADARANLKKLTDASADELHYAKDRYNKFQVLKCPWCGTKLVKDVSNRRLIGAWGYEMKDRNHFRLKCTQPTCFFYDEDSLPIQIVDEELYLNPPTLLFGTVDKFAMLPWNPSIGGFFGLDKPNRSPELIIQDELHLISGPLGTMVGLYEAAIDALCQKKGIKTKIIASTATIRRAVQQCASLYDRKVSQFPHPGLDAEDSFFAKEAGIDHENEKYGRKYIGLMPAGKTKAMMEIRSVAALMQKIKDMDLPDDVRDKYWTLTVYFNSLKDLGKATTLVADDIKDFLKRMAFRLGTANNARMIVSADELTSRISTTQLNETLDKLEKVSYSKENIENKNWPSNILLATNMISVGIDVARLNVMLLVGQPKLTSEYIQASSRVGREFPGVAFAMYDGSKSRDRSHYEQFKSYHQSFYKYVEPTGVTPFSKPARERALHAVVIALLRYLCPNLKDENCAGKFSRTEYAAEIASITEYIINRNRSVINMVNPNMSDDAEAIQSEIDNFVEKWELLIDGSNAEKFFYGNKFMMHHPEEDEYRLMKAFNTDKGESALDTMTSMRNVDITVGSSIIVWEE